MREITDEITPYRFKPAQSRKILHKQKAAAGMCIWNDNELQKLMACRHLNGLGLHLARLLAAPPCFNKLMVAHNFGDTTLDGVGCLKKFPGGRVSKLDQSLRIGDEHAICKLIK